MLVCVGVSINSILSLSMLNMSPFDIQRYTIVCAGCHGYALGQVFLVSSGSTWALFKTINVDQR